MTGDVTVTVAVKIEKKQLPKAITAGQDGCAARDLNPEPAD